MKRFRNILIILCFPIVAIAQFETTLPTLDRLHQSSYTNPAILPSYAASIGLPVLSGMGFNGDIKGISTSVVVNSIDTANRLDLNKFYNNISNNNIGFGMGVNLEVLHVRFKVKKWFYGINLSTKVSNEIGLSKEFLGLAIQGTDYFAGRTMDASSTRIAFMAYNELGFSAAHKFNQITLGGRVKYLQGLATAQLNDFTFKWEQPSSPTGDIIVTTRGTLNTASLPYLLDSLNGKSHKSEIEASSFTGFSNTGWGLDLGAFYDLNKDLKVGASVIDWGWISWNNQTYNYTSNENSVVYSGVNLDQMDNDSLRQEYLDSLVNATLPVASDKSFETALPLKVFLTASYKIHKKIRVGAMYQGHRVQNEFRNAYTLSLTTQLGNGFDVTTNYSNIAGTFNTFGLGIVGKAGPIQTYLIVDNIIPSYSHLVSFRFGMNVVWGEAVKKRKYR